MKIGERVVIGVMGRIGSGKSEASRYIAQRYGGRVFRFSDVLKDVLQRLYLPPRRENFITLGTALRRGFGDGVIARALKRDILASDARVVVVDGVRYPEEVEMIKSFENSVLLYIHASPEVRYQRAVKRGEKGEATISYEEFLKNDGAETEKRIEELAKLADHRIDNNGTLEELHTALDEGLEGVCPRN
ncbi:MAG: AAA family ATPase [Euryarchaeota archaeon]|nr:AAA family ATPase [Euryarchaeota archaeon]